MEAPRCERCQRAAQTSTQVSWEARRGDYLIPSCITNSVAGTQVRKDWIECDGSDGREVQIPLSVELTLADTRPVPVEITRKVPGGLVPRPELTHRGCSWELAKVSGV